MLLCSRLWQLLVDHEATEAACRHRAAASVYLEGSDHVEAVLGGLLVLVEQHLLQLVVSGKGGGGGGGRRVEQEGKTEGLRHREEG